MYYELHSILVREHYTLTLFDINIKKEELIAPLKSKLTLYIKQQTQLLTHTI